jgi:hypothetical protein
VRSVVPNVPVISQHDLNPGLELANPGIIEKVAGSVGETGTLFSSSFSVSSILWSFPRYQIVAEVLLLPSGPVILYVCVAGKH